MNKKIIFKYVLMYIPAVIGGIMFGYGSINIVSSLLLFLGGYIAIKNTFDYRKVKKNMGISNIELSQLDKQYEDYNIQKSNNNTNERKKIESIKYTDDINFNKRTNMKVRKRVK